MHDMHDTPPSAPRLTVLTGDRPTGPLHLGHYVGSLKTRLELQETHTQYLLVADTQAMTDNAHDPDKVRRNVLEVALGSILSCRRACAHCKRRSMARTASKDSASDRLID